MGPLGATKLVFEKVRTKKPLHEGYGPYEFLSFRDGKGRVRDPEQRKFKEREWNIGKPNQLGLGAMSDSSLTTLFALREYIRGWRFYNSFNINNERIRKPVPTSQQPVLYEDAGNLSAVLFYLMTEHSEVFDELKSVIKMAIPGFRGLTVKARGGPGEVIAFWDEANLDTELSLADLSDGTLRFIAWATLCVMPNPPTLICIDEPDQGVHPRTLPILADLFKKATERTQLILATHASYFLIQFGLDSIAVMIKAAGESSYVVTQSSKALLDNLEDFGTDELERMHRTDELEAVL